MKLILLFFFTLSLFVSEAQEKFEREYKIPVDSVPAVSIEFMERLVPDRKIRWIREISQEGTTTEAKVKDGKRKLSVEFTLSGDLIDLEIEIDKKHILSNQAITNTLNKTYKKYKIERVQLQIKGYPQEVIDFYTKATDSSFLDMWFRYEIIIRGKKDQEFHRYELLFDYDGTLVKEYVIVPFKNDNLEF